MRFVKIMGVPFLNIDQSSFIQLLDERIQQKKRTFVVTANPEIVMKAKQDSNFMKTIQQATYITADGIGIVKAAKLLNDPLPGRVTGFDTMMGLLEIANEKQYTIFLLGAKQETLDNVVEKLKKTYPGIQIVGAHNGYFDWENNDIADRVAETKPDITFVALGVPKQEQWIAENLHRVEYGVMIGIGGSFDVIAGTVNRAPVIWQKLNIEWLYRLIQQPSRWRRMLALPRFAWQIIRIKMKGSNHE
ncbi:WecB/TagA/CpsF family glycosyltransferase [Fervidibacillus albus]|uniref:N-acetylglucosaminyldiphosphoundecaprenol N-acetyl-beta-D-mannosaminyltransferase n=1 Tax=Fervidibacillus albus TaxID=2980026 RepID=A0A9E8LUE4_9BACI|nr:WecB/TagA/CpsF family glycosyltransferase [Fervidibacillus albus]WAA09696.1 WecB/TagA/CpsF family glycosyltransferase [Fervidibacillus albus]